MRRECCATPSTCFRLDGAGRHPHQQLFARGALRVFGLAQVGDVHHQRLQLDRLTRVVAVQRTATVEPVHGPRGVAQADQDREGLPVDLGLAQQRLDAPQVFGDSPRAQLARRRLWLQAQPGEVLTARGDDPRAEVEGDGRDLRHLHDVPEVGFPRPQRLGRGPLGGDVAEGRHHQVLVLPANRVERDLDRELRAVEAARAQILSVAHQPPPGAGREGPHVGRVPLLQTLGHQARQRMSEEVLPRGPEQLRRHLIAAANDAVAIDQENAVGQRLDERLDHCTLLATRTAPSELLGRHHRPLPRSRNLCGAWTIEVAVDGCKPIVSKAS